MKFTIDRSKWRCGGDFSDLVEKTGRTKLLNEKGFMCCLGFCSIALGAKENEILNVGTPAFIPSFQYRKESNLLCNLLSGTQLTENSKFAEQAMDINDDWHLSNEEREQKLSELFISEGQEVEFVGEYYDS